MTIEEMIGKKFGRWTALSQAESKKDHRGYNITMIKCRCDCGVERDVMKYTLLNGKSQSCGCRHSEIMHNMFPDSDMIGKRFGRGVVDSFAYMKNRSKVWNMVCDCGNKYVASTADLHRKHVLSCGCYHRDDRTIHGGVANKERLFGIWMGMRRRCSDKNNIGYERYGGRGIIVCKEWDNDYAVFREWALANGYKDGLTIDRINFDGNYCPDNCRWVTPTQQTRNTSYNRYEEIDGVTKSVAQWMDDYGVINRGAVYRRLRHGWSMKDAIFTPVRKGGKPILPG